MDKTQKYIQDLKKYREKVEAIRTLSSEERQIFRNKFEDLAVAVNTAYCGLMENSDRESDQQIKSLYKKFRKIYGVRTRENSNLNIELETAANFIEAILNKTE